MNSTAELAPLKKLRTNAAALALGTKTHCVDKVERPLGNSKITLTIFLGIQSNVSTLC